MAAHSTYDVRFVLGSSSPARLKTLRNAGLDPQVISPDVDESSVQAADTAALVRELALLKLAAVEERVDEDDALILTCDSLFELDGQPLGKPANVDDAVSRWRRMRGRVGTLWTGHCLKRHPGTDVVCGAIATQVRFAEVSDAEIDWYVATGEPSRVAGAFTIDGLGGWFVEGIAGDHHNVVGLSLPWLRSALGQLGFSVTGLAVRPG